MYHVVRARGSALGERVGVGYAESKSLVLGSIRPGSSTLISLLIGRARKRTGRVVPGRSLPFRLASLEFA